MQPKITKVSQTTMPGPDKLPVAAITVEYMIGTHGPFSETVPKLGFNIATVNAAMQAMSAAINALP